MIVGARQRITVSKKLEFLDMSRKFHPSDLKRFILKGIRICTNMTTLSTPRVSTSR